MANTIFSGDRVRALRAALQLNTAATIASGAVDPTVSAPGISLSVGSIYLSTSTGKIYQKHTTSGDDTNFYEVQTSDSIAALAADVADLVTLSGVPANSTTLGTFTGSTIPDNRDIKQALQDLETAVEGRATVALDNLTTTAINADLDPSANNVRDMGDDTLRWRRMFTNRINVGALATNFQISSSAALGVSRPSGGSYSTGIYDETNTGYLLGNGAGFFVEGLNNSGATQQFLLRTGASSANASGDIRLQTGTAATTRGSIILDALAVSSLSNIAMNNNKVTGLAAPTSAGDALRYDELGAANGIATLDAGGKVPVSQLPNSVMEYKGTWAASTNTPTLADGVGNAGDVYIASDAGTVNFGSGNITFAAGDWVIYDGSIWQKSINSNAVVSVNGYTGVVVLDTADISEDPTNLYFTETRVRDTDLAGFVSGPGSVSATDSVLEAIQKLDGNNLATQDDVDDLVTLSGVAVNSVDLGTFTGTTIPDNSDIKEALQALETSVEGKANTTLNNLGSTAVNVDILPDANVSRNLGSNSLLWNTVRAYRVATSNTIVSFTGDTTSGSGLISNISSTTGLIVGQSVFGTGIEEGSVIIAINPGVSITIDPAASATNTGVSLKASYSGFFRSEDQTTEPSGIALIRSGNATTGQTGALILRSGNTTTGKTGDVFFRSGVSTSGGTTGNVNIATGATSGTRGSISVVGNGISLNALGANINANTNKIINVVDPTSDQDAATKKYVDDAIAGGGGATTELDNLTTTAINAALNPDTDNTYSLGTASLQWSDIHAFNGRFKDASIIRGATEEASLRISSSTLTEKLELRHNVDAQTSTIEHSGTGAFTIQTQGANTLDILSNDGDLSLYAQNNVYLTADTGNAELFALGTMTVASDGDLSLTTFGTSDIIFNPSGSGVLNFSAKALTNVADPTNAQDGATKAYVDASSAQGSSDLTLTAGDTIAADTTSTHQIIVVQGNSAGTTTLSTTPFGTGAAKNGQLITLIGNSTTNLVQIDNNNAAKGCVMNASWVGGQYDSITFLYSSALDRYVEIARNN